MTSYSEKFRELGTRVRVCCKLNDGSLAVGSSEGLFFFGGGLMGGGVLRMNYNTTDNLQRYYLDYDFTLDGVGVTLSSNAITLESNKGDTASAITYSLNRATGIASGTLTSFSEYQNKNVTKCPHYGMLIFTRDAAAPLADNIWTAGFFIRKATKTWNESLPFNILSEEIDRDWSEATLPSDGEE